MVMFVNAWRPAERGSVALLIHGSRGFGIGEWPGKYSYTLFFVISPGRVYLPFREFDEPFEVQVRAREGLPEEDLVDCNVRA